MSDTIDCPDCDPADDQCSSCEGTGSILTAVTPEQIVEQRGLGWPDFHPESYCHRCGRLNVRSWWINSTAWNLATAECSTRGVMEILCPQCFTQTWEKVTGLSVSWELRIDPATLAAAEKRREASEATP